MICKRRVALLGFALCVSTCLLLSARLEAGEAEDKFQLDISEALSARRAGDPLASAAIITAEKCDRVLADGALTLNDYLSEVPGFDGTTAFWHTWPTARGLADSVNLMVDGVSLTSPIDYRVPSSLGLFLEEFDQLEITSGPAGVPWGAHSLMGVINLTTGRISHPETRYRLTVGERNLQRMAIRHDLALGPGYLRLFAGYALAQQPSFAPETAWQAVPPYAHDWALEASPATPRSPTDKYGIVSAHFSTPSVDAYVRVPFTAEHYQVSELGGVFGDGQGGARQSIDALAYLALHRTLWDGRAAVLARVSWVLFDETFDQKLLPPSTAVPMGARSVRETRMSRIVALTEGSLRQEGGRLSNTAMLGLDGTAEVPHASSFARVDPWVEGALVGQGPVVKDETMLTGSAYIFDELRMWNRLSLAAGARYNMGGRTYRDAMLYQGNAGVRLFSRSHIKFGVTEGFRPPTLLDRAGTGQPVRGDSELLPERARAFQAEANSVFSWPGVIERGFVRGDFARTTTRDNIFREGLLFASYDLRPVAATSGFSIDSAEAVLNLELAPLRARLDASYGWTMVRRTAGTLETNENSESPNHGPRHRWFARFDVTPHPAAVIGALMEGQCGGDWAVAGAPPLVAGTSRSLQPPTVITRNRPCVVMPGARLQFPADPKSLSVIVSARNLLDQRTPVGLFSMPELSLAEADIHSTRGRTIFVALDWRSSLEQDW